MRALAAGLLMALLMTAGCSDDGGDDGEEGDDGGAGASLSGGPSGSASAGASASGSASSSGTGGPAAGSGGEATISVAAVGAYPANPAFEPPVASVPAGALVHVTFSNDDLVPVIQHNWVVEGITGASSDTIAPGAESTFDFTAPTEPGEFAFYCSIGDHRDRGMEGTLTVTA